MLGAAFGMIPLVHKTKEHMVLFTLTGFTEVTGFRVFAFEATEADRSRTKYTVRADLALSRQYGIRIQELPLLCRGLLDRRAEGDTTRALTLTQEDMQLHAAASSALDAAKRKKGMPPQVSSGAH
jgi:hypothetical protein